MKFLIALVWTFCYASAVSYGNWENVYFTRTLDLKKGYVKETDVVQIKNLDDKPQDTYYFPLSDGIGEITKLSAFIATFLDQVVILGSELVEIEELEGKALTYKLTLPAPVAPGSTVDIKARYVYTSGLSPLPAKIEMKDVQHILLTLNKYAYSPYQTNQYQLVFTGITKGQEMDVIDGSDSEQEPDNLPKDFKPRIEDKSLVYGPIFESLPPFTVKSMGLLYEHNRPLAKAYNLERSIWIPASNSDKVSIEEYYELTNAGAELSNGFSRVDWMQGRYESTRNHWALSQLEVKLPDNIESEGIYYTDKVGQVDTSKEYQGYLVLQPRYPLFGGWNYNFTIGWYNPLSVYLHKLTEQEDTYMVKFPVLSTIQDISYDNVKVNFYLPEDSEFVGVSSAIDYESIEVGNELSYFDVSGGHVKVTLTFKNLIDDLSKVDLFVQYKYTAASYWLKVFKISGFVFTGLISYYLLRLIDISIEKK
ncbi:dolichyl-diphosphooligosaccharide--protein glycosyltransferase subunit 1 [[Candida] railenensis]|uniref:Dolichyl-diphosphooligosaccharide--protein glycosyltransferase subunit 1 n=1 Tax=[Candida] railenensis TaxID=45579 RepID=A0A9P0QSI5_9ASCO|nr:dolichyl-diphosphooligosaccharide--protein glycosyltransferase subunit 1 [[Candida] railenensis]